MGSLSVSGGKIDDERWQVFRLHRSASAPLPLGGGGAAVESSGPSDDHYHNQQHWRSFDSSVDAVSFGFVATAILISMFLVMAIFERFLRPNSSSPHPPPTASSSPAAVSRRLRRQGNGESDPQGFRHLELGLNPKLGFPSPKMTVYTKGVSVLMPGEEIPTFIAHPVPVPCPPERIDWHLHQHNRYWNPNPLNPNRNSSNRDHGSLSFQV